MLQTILSRSSVSITEFRRKPVECMKAGKGEPVAILSNNEPVFYCIPAKEYGELLQELEDAKNKLKLVDN
ncbi:antitoxin of toxin-antitoxin stability system [Erwinia sp. OLTSP20]|uniref:type II toxin-antitoxin system Phd/YefM family antitoxin n=1 Tax=Enterobacterales TaxID=91347 RepID=UPI000C18B06F|nr:MULTISPECIES: type II toxin-antitoxin system prevent-host-death family antitoxin [Enterobacterales]PII85134.1 antitoxin of toxin-antitoxin stability system [Serratia sp. OLFL2]PIJ49359.1 antitoxin of toxin-antitoxin stability system [Erwinia sp. OAMSP11]PIJ69754.1 antitoxin of toxin-antitoxin stability system [Erwinia sp. OLSSP12]PIJ76238.1 antitoxin of toxin-antitoxin stability system [Erwinia sp. OLCASP19]PIJ76721.1 antitoxin of toxin-antitoxin stability system [Erwinia sp. OLMTSP26]